MKPEETIESYLISCCEKSGLICLKFVSPGTKGVPDRIVIGNGHTIFIELKAPGKKERKLQKYIIKKMRKAGAIVYVADTKEDVDAILSEIRKA